MTRKYVFTGETKRLWGHTLHRVMAARDFGQVKKGEFGGWIAEESNLSHEGFAWVGDDAVVFESAQVLDGAQVVGNSKVHGKALIRGNARITERARVSGSAIISGNSVVTNNAHVTDAAIVLGHAHVGGGASVSGSAMIYMYTHVCGDARVRGSAYVYDTADVAGNAIVDGDACVCGDASVSGGAVVRSGALISKNSHICWFTHVGSEFGTLTAYLGKNKELRITRGCFEGTLSEFEKAVQDTHQGSKNAKDYEALIQFLRIRFEVPVEEAAE
ncbi:polymer-forming cytoskeletal protein [Listeria monocytogenes]|nr:polymer-forming cytoskeletal protein [Listeria monocytogenes]